MYHERNAMYVFSHRFLQACFKLPVKSTIMSWVRKYQFTEGFCPNLLELLKLRVSTLKLRVSTLKEENRVCVLMADELSLKRGVEYNASRDTVTGIVAKRDKVYDYVDGALVLMVAGLKTYWRQAFSYFFVQNAMPSERMQSLIFEALDKLKNIGLKVLVISSDQGSNFTSTINQLGVSKEQPFFWFQGEKVFAIADMPHVLKNIRNCLLCNNIKSSKELASWSILKNVDNSPQK